MYEHVYTHYAWICMNMYLYKHVYVCVCMDYVSTIYVAEGKGAGAFLSFCVVYSF